MKIVVAYHDISTPSKAHWI